MGCKICLYNMSLLQLDKEGILLIICNSRKQGDTFNKFTINKGRKPTKKTKTQGCQSMLGQVVCGNHFTISTKLNSGFPQKLRTQHEPYVFKKQ